MRVGYTQVRELTPAELALIPDDELAREFGAERRRQQYRCGRSLLRLMLQDWTGKPAPSHQLRVTDVGKPVCNDGPAISITHAGDQVACCIADAGDIGIDLEVVTGHRDTTKLAKKFFSAEEADWLTTQPDDRFYMLWVLKEAYVKAIGKSIFGSVNKLRCKVLPPAIQASEDSAPFHDLCLFAAGDKLMALVTTEASLRDVTLERWDPGSEALRADSEFRVQATSYDYVH